MTTPRLNKQKDYGIHNNGTSPTKYSSSEKSKYLHGACYLPTCILDLLYSVNLIIYVTNSIGNARKVWDRFQILITNKDIARYIQRQNLMVHWDRLLHMWTSGGCLVKPWLWAAAWWPTNMKLPCISDGFQFYDGPPHCCQLIYPLSVSYNAATSAKISNMRGVD